MAHSEIRLSVAEERTIYDVAAIERAMEEAAGNRNEALATLYEKMKQRGGQSERPKQPAMPMRGRCDWANATYLPHSVRKRCFTCPMALRRGLSSA